MNKKRTTQRGESMDDDGPTNVMTFLQVWRDVANKEDGGNNKAWTKALEAKGDENVVLEARFQMGQTPDLYRRCTTFPLAAARTTPIHGFAFSQRAGQIGILMAMKGELATRRVDYHREVRKLLKYVDWVYKQESIREFLVSKLGESDNEQAKLMLKNLQEGGLMTFKDEAQTKAVHILIEIMGPVLQQTAVIKAWMKQLAMHGINLGQALSKPDVPNKIKYLEKVDSVKLDADSFDQGIANICIALGMCALPVPKGKDLAQMPKRPFTSKQPTKEARRKIYSEVVDVNDYDFNPDFNPTLQYESELPIDQTKWCQWTPILATNGTKWDKERASSLAQVSVLSAIHKWATKENKGEIAAAAELLIIPHLYNIECLGQQPKETLQDWYTSPIHLDIKTFYLAPLSWDDNQIYISTHPSLLKADDADVKAMIETETSKANKAKVIITEEEKKAAVAAAVAAEVAAAGTRIEAEAKAKIQEIQRRTNEEVTKEAAEYEKQIEEAVEADIEEARKKQKERLSIAIAELEEEAQAKITALEATINEELATKNATIQEIKEYVAKEISRKDTAVQGADEMGTATLEDLAKKISNKRRELVQIEAKLAAAKAADVSTAVNANADQSLLAGLHVHSSTGVDIGDTSSSKDDVASNRCLVYQTVNLDRAQPYGTHTVTNYAKEGYNVERMDPELTVQVFDTLIHILHKLTQLDAEEAAVEERINEFESNTERMRPTEEVEAKRRKTLVWEDATRSAALSGDRLYSFFRQLSGTAGESMNAVVQIDDAQYQRDVAKSREQATKLSTAASERFASLIESTFAGLFRQSGLTFAIGGNPTQEVQIISGNLRKQLTDLATSEVGGLFSKSVELEQLIESAKGKLTLAELVQQLRSIGEVLQQSTYMAAYQPNSSLSIETISQPQNSLVLNVRDVATAAINIAYDNLERELHYHYHRMRVPNVYELIEGRDVGMSNAFATLCAHVMVQQRLHAGAAAAYVTKWSASANARMLGVALKKAVEAVCSYTSRFKPPGAGGRQEYFAQS